MCCRWRRRTRTRLLRRGDRMSTLAIRDDQDRFDQGQIAALKQLGVENASQGDLDLFFYQCKRTGLDPFLRQTHMISRNTFNTRTNAWEVKWTIQTGIDGFRLVGRRAATKTGETLGMKPSQWRVPAGWG